MPTDVLKYLIYATFSLFPLHLCTRTKTIACIANQNRRRYSEKSLFALYPVVFSYRDVSRDVYFLPLAKKYLNGGNGRVWSMKFFIFQASLRKQAPDDMASVGMIDIIFCYRPLACWTNITEQKR